jgi:hypothetical protein
MQTRTLALLAAAALVAGGAAIYAVGQRNKAATPADLAGQPVFPGLSAKIDGVARIEIERNGETFEIARAADGAWVMPARAGYPIDFAQVRRLALEVAGLRVLEARTANPALHGEIDLDGAAKDQKATRVALYGAQGPALADLLAGRTRFGRQGTAGDGTFVRKVGDNQVWFVQGRLQIEREAAKWLERRVADVARERIAKVSIRAEGAKTDVSRAKPDQADFDLAGVPEGKKVKSPFDVNLVASAIEGLDLEDVRKAEGLSFDAGTAEYATFEGLTVRVAFAKDGADLWARIEANYAAPAAAVEGEKLKKPEDAAKDAEAISKRAAGWAFRLPQYKLEYMTRKVADLVEDKGA